MYQVTMNQQPQQPLYPSVHETQIGPQPPPYYFQENGSGAMPMPQPQGQFYPNPVYVQTSYPQSSETTTVITSQPQVIMAAPAVNSHQPMNIECPQCHQQVTTSISRDVGMMNHLIAGVTSPICCCTLIPCCLVAYCIDGFKDTTHRCPNCNQVVGSAKRLS